MANPAVVGTPTGHASTVNGQTSTGAVGGTFTAGNALFAQVEWTYSGTSVTGQISLPTGWTDAGPGNVNDGAPNGVTRWYYLLNNPGGAQTWTWTASALSGSPTFEAWNVLIVEISGAATSGSPFDLAVVSNKTGASAATPIDTTAASGTTASTTLLLQMAAVARSTITISGSNSGSVPTSGWTVSAKTSSTNSTVNAHSVCQYQALSVGVTSPRGEITPNTSCSWMTALLTIKAAGNTTTTKTQTGKARVQVTDTKTQTGTARITVHTTKTQSGVARITVHTTKTQSGVSNIRTTTTKTQSGKARVQVHTTKTQTGVARLSVTTTKTQTGKSRITVHTTKTQGGVANVRNTTTRTITGVAKIGNNATTTRNQTGVARIQVVVDRTQAGKGRIQVRATRTITGKASLVTRTTKTQTGKARITATIGRTISGVANITGGVAPPATGAAVPPILAVQRAIRRRFQRQQVQLFQALLAGGLITQEEYVILTARLK